MTYWAIRHKPSGGFLPAGRKRGFTHDQPSTELPPRLFTKRRAAKAALRCWLMGDWKEETSGGSSYYGDDYDIYPVPPSKPPADRKPEEMEVVMLLLVAIEDIGDPTTYSQQTTSAPFVHNLL
jgi:hypothetical protein